MRVLFVNTNSSLVGGADRNCFDLITGLRRRGHEVRLLAKQNDDGIEPPAPGTLIPSTVSHTDRDSLPARRRAAVVARALWNPDAALATRSLIASERPDVVHAHKLYPQISVAPIVEASRAGVPVIQSVHDYEFISASTQNDTGSRLDRDESALQYRLLNTLLFQVKRRAHVPRIDLWLANSSYTADRYREHGIGSQVLDLFATRHDADLPSFEERGGVLFTGRLQPHKGIRDLIAAARIATDLRFVIAGEGPLADWVEAQAAELENVKYAGWIAEREALDVLARNARVVAVPSLWSEPGGLVALEAMAAGTPVVCYPRGGLGSNVAESEAGIVTEPDPVSLARALQRLHDDRGEWVRCAENAQSATRTRFSADAAVERLLDYYREASLASSASN